MNIPVKFTEQPCRIAANFEEQSRRIAANLGVLQVVKEYVGGEPYKGKYTVIPSAEAQMLPTNGKVMTDDVTVEKIPYAEVLNNSGGTTATIGG